MDSQVLFFSVRKTTTEPPPTDLPITPVTLCPPKKTNLA